MSYDRLKVLTTERRGFTKLAECTGKDSPTNIKVQ